MQRIAILLTVAAAAVGPSAGSASARFCCDDGAAVGTPSTQLQAAKPAKKIAKQHQDSRPARLVYLGRH